MGGELEADLDRRSGSCKGSLAIAKQLRSYSALTEVKESTLRMFLSGQLKEAGSVNMHELLLEPFMAPG